MRRLWANVLIAGASVITIFAATPSTINKVSTNGDYSTQRQFTYQLSKIEEKDDGIVTKDISSTSAKEIAKDMEQRLISSKVTSYSVSTSGDDLVTVTFHAGNDTEYGYITKYLSFSGSFALVNTQGDLITGDKFLNGSAYQKDVSVNEYPTVIIPVKTDSTEYQSLISQARENPEEETDEESGETTKSATIYLLYNYVEGDTYDKLTESGKFEEKVFLTFDAIDDASLYHNGINEDGKAAFAQVCGFSDSNGNGVADASEVSAAFAQADYLVNLLNAKALDYDVKLIKGDTEDTKIVVQPNVESLLNNNNKAAFNATMISIVVAVIVISLLLVVFFRLGALNIATVTLLNVFLTFLFITMMGLEYTSYAIFGYIAVAIVSLVSGIIYCQKLKDEAYRGRSLKKANQEASKKSLLPIVDMNIVGIVVGLMIFLIGGSAVHALGAIVTLGSLISLVLSTLGLKGLMWLATNATGLVGKYEVFGINSENVPDHMAEEKQRFFGAYADKDFSKKKKSVSIVSASLFGVALIGIILSASLNSGNLFKQPSSKITGSEIYVTSKFEYVSSSKEESNLTRDQITDLFKDIVIYNDGETLPSVIESTDSHILANQITTDLDNVKEFVLDIDTYEDDKSLCYNVVYYTYDLKSYINGDQVNAKSISGAFTTDKLNVVLATISDDFVTSEEALISLKTKESSPNVPNADWQKVSLATFVAILILTLYFMLRYRLSRGLAMLVYPFVASGITLGLFVILSACGLSLPVNIVASLPIILILTYTFMVMFANKERDLLSEDKVKDNTLEHRVEVSKKAMGMAFTPIICVVAVSAYLLVNFFGFAPAVNSFSYLAALIGLLVALGAVVITFPALSNLLFKWFSKVSVNKKPRKAKKNTQIVKKSAEPEEAIFIGIND